MTDDVFDRILNTLDGPMAIVTAYDGTERSGCLVGFHTQCSLKPRRWLVCISKLNHTLRVARRSRALAVHLLRADQIELARLFGTTTEDEIDKFARCGWREGPGGVPILAGCDWIVGSVLERIDLGDHVGHLIAATEAGHEHADGPQLGYQLCRTIAAGHPPE